MDNQQLEALKRIYGGTMSQKEVDLLRDVQAFIDFCIDNGLSFRTAIGTIAHDANGVLAPGEMFDRGIFAPKTAGYRKIVSQLDEQMAGMASDAQLQKELGQG